MCCFSTKCLFPDLFLLLVPSSVVVREYTVRNFNYYQPSRLALWPEVSASSASSLCVWQGCVFRCCWVARPAMFIPVKLLESTGRQLIFRLLVLGTPESGVLASLSFASFYFVYFHTVTRGACLGHLSLSLVPDTIVTTSFWSLVGPIVLSATLSDVRCGPSSCLMITVTWMHFPILYFISRIWFYTWAGFLVFGVPSSLLLSHLTSLLWIEWWQQFTLSFRWRQRCSESTLQRGLYWSCVGCDAWPCFRWVLSRVKTCVLGVNLPRR